MQQFPAKTFVMIISHAHSFSLHQFRVEKQAIIIAGKISVGKASQRQGEYRAIALRSFESVEYFAINFLNLL